MIQIDMDMPEYCNSNECLLCHFNGHVFYCRRKDGLYPVGDISNQWNKPPKDCPLKEVKCGKWVNDECTNCGYVVRPWNNTPYCPSCGAKMEK